MLRVFSFGGEIERFWNKVDKTDSCWLWQGKPNGKGYGRFGVNWQVVLAHRFAWEITYGTIPDGLAVCHKCDIPACVNPSHLFLGTLIDNNADMRAKGRGVNPPAKANRTSFQTGITSGENHPLAKMTQANVEEARILRARGWKLKDIAAKYGVRIPTVFNAIKGNTWKEVGA